MSQPVSSCTDGVLLVQLFSSIFCDVPLSAGIQDGYCLNITSVLIVAGQVYAVSVTHP